MSFGTLANRADGTWDVSRVEGLPPQSLDTSGTARKPSLVIHPWQRSGSVSSLRELTANSFNHHLGIQAAERFSAGDPDGDGVVNELTRADVTAATLFQATLPAPGAWSSMIPALNAPCSRAKGCSSRFAARHIPSLPLDRKRWIYTEGGVSVDLTSATVPQPRLIPASPDASTIRVPLCTDFKLHDITDAADRTAAEPLAHSVAPPRLPAVLALEVSPARSSTNSAGTPAPDRRHGEGEPDVG